MEPKCLSYSAPRRLSLSISVLFLSLSPPSCQCTVGSQVAMRVGGDFFFDPSPSDPTVNLLLVAGGVGINPLYSILLHATDLLHLNHASGGLDYNIGSVNLCYSAKNTQELLFKVCYIIFHCWNIFFCIFFFFLLWSTTVSTCMSTSGSSVAICKQKLYYYLPSVFPELHR